MHQITFMPTISTNGGGGRLLIEKITGAPLVSNDMGVLDDGENNIYNLIFGFQ